MSLLNLGTLPYQDKSVSFWKNPHQFIEKNLEDNPRRVFLCRYLLITFDAKHIPLVNRTVFWPVISYIMWPRVVSIGLIPAQISRFHTMELLLH